MNVTSIIPTEVSTSRFVRIRERDFNLQIHYNDVGQGHDTVIMLHGSGPGATSWANFSRNITPLTEAGYRVILLDFPGWGESDPIVCDAGSRAELNASALKGLMDAVELDRAHLIGNSMGAHSAVAFALANPARVGKLILMGGGAGGRSLFAPSPTEGIKLIQALYRDPTIDNLKRMMNTFVYDTKSLTEDLFKLRLDNMLARRYHLENFIKSAEINPNQYPDVGPRLSEIAASVLVIWGRDDRFVPMDTGLRLIGGIPDVQMHIFNRCGHWAQWEHADAFNRMVKDFLTH